MNMITTLLLRPESKRLFLFAAIILLFSCTGKTDGDGSSARNGDTIDKDTAIGASSVFYYIPSPIELVTLIKRAGASYDKEMMNAPENVSTYTSSSARALNLGVYGADLSMAGIFNQAEESMAYMGCANRLADALHISSAFNADMRKRLEKNMSNRDSVLNIITEAYWECDALLQDNKQEQASALMIAGGWVEGLYLACSVAEKTNNSDIRFRVAEQRFSLVQLIELLGKQKNADAKSLQLELKELQAIFDRLPAALASASPKQDDSILVIGADNGPEPVSLNALELKQILSSISKIRNGIISRS